MNWRDAWRLLAGAVRGFVAHGAARKGAALAFYTLFSLAPVVTVVLLVVGLLVDESLAREAFAAQLAALIGPESARTVLAAPRWSARPPRSRN